MAEDPKENAVGEKLGIAATRKVSGFIELVQNREQEAIKARKELFHPATIQPRPRWDEFFACDHSKRFESVNDWTTQIS